MAATRLASSKLLIFALPALPIAMMHVPAGAIIPGFYAKFTSISLETIGWIFLITRLFDAVSDPAIGYLSDRFDTRWGKRKPWVVAGALICSVSVFAMFTPSPSSGWAYMLACFIALYFGWTVMEIPYRAWSAEISHNYSERSRISTYIASFGALGTVLFMSVPLLPFFDSTEIGADTLLAMAILIIALLLPLTGIAVWKVDEGKPLPNRRVDMRRALKSFGSNRPFQIFAASYVFGGLANGLFVALFFTYVDSYLMIGAQFAILYVCNATANFLGMPLWYAIMRKTGKHMALGASWMLYGALLLTMALLVEPGSGAFWPMIALAIIIGFAEASIRIAPYAIVGDIADYDTVKNDLNRTGSFFAVLTLIAKFNFAIGGGLGFILLGVVGYEVGGANDAFSETGFLLIIAGLPALLYAIATIIISRYPLTATRHAKIQRILEKRTYPKNATVANTVPND